MSKLPSKCQAGSPPICYCSRRNYVDLRSSAVSSSKMPAGGDSIFQRGLSSGTSVETLARYWTQCGLAQHDSFGGFGILHYFSTRHTLEWTRGDTAGAGLTSWLSCLDAFSTSSKTNKSRCTERDTAETKEMSLQGKKPS